ncbi:MAG: hypothetical protein JW994_00525 [Candidatus Omnitrophica bacterium]|nr:hypothetical protein [Candidatus Omnitrophota bacterium]
MATIKTIWILILATIFVGFVCWSIFSLTTRTQYIISMLEASQGAKSAKLRSPTWYDLYSFDSAERAKRKASRTQSPEEAFSME